MSAQDNKARAALLAATKYFNWPLFEPGPVKVRTCRVCGCTDADCSGCVERTGEPCHWVGADLCSACVGRKKGRT